MNETLAFILIFGAIALVFPALPLVGMRLLAPKKPSPSKGEPYECGTESSGDPWVRFGAQYYIYGLIFVLFDVEAVFLFPWAVVFRHWPDQWLALVEMGVFLLVVAVGLVYAWKSRALEWS